MARRFFAQKQIQYDRIRNIHSDPCPAAYLAYELISQTHKIRPPCVGCASQTPPVRTAPPHFASSARPTKADSNQPVSPLWKRESCSTTKTTDLSRKSEQTTARCCKTMSIGLHIAIPSEVLLHDTSQLSHCYLMNTPLPDGIFRSWFMNDTDGDDGGYPVYGYDTKKFQCPGAAVFGCDALTKAGGEL